MKFASATTTYQRFERYTELYGKQTTLAVIFSDGTQLVASGDLQAGYANSNGHFRIESVQMCS
jgi:hypothetical protein